jgi:hypothetical protein
MLLKDSSNVVVENALDKLMACKAISDKEKSGYLKLTQGLSGQNNNIRTKWLEYAYMLSKDEALKKSYLDELTRLCGANYEFRTRVNAANSIKRLKVLNADIAMNLIDACLSYNGRLSGPCMEVLMELKKDAGNNDILKAAISKCSAEQKERLKGLE